MASKSKASAFVCSDCGAEYAKWAGKCTNCGQWNTIKEFRQGRSGGGGAGKANRQSMSGLRDSLEAATGTGEGNAAAGGAGRRGSWLGQASSPLMESLATPSTTTRGRRLPLGSPELDRALGGGLMSGGITLLAGPPGIGKSTVLLQVARCVAEAMPMSPAPATAKGRGRKPTAGGAGGGGATGDADGAIAWGASMPVAYISGEESASQLRDRAERLGTISEHVKVMNETSVDVICEALEGMAASLGQVEDAHGPDGRTLGLGLIIIDSIQTMYLEGVASSPGSITQVRECAVRFTQLGKALNVPVILVGHVTKQGEVAGPRVLEHIVDTVLTIDGDGGHPTRIIRCSKNRFGPTHEVGIMRMDEAGLADVDDIGSMFVSDACRKLPPGKEQEAEEAGEEARPPPVGAAVACVMEGSRPLCVEVQALSTQSAADFPRHRATGIKTDRLHMLLAVLSKHCGIRARNTDIFANVVGGLRPSDPALDLPIALAIASSLLERPLPKGLASMAEVGLTGELRPPLGALQRRSAAGLMGFDRVLMGKADGGQATGQGRRGGKVAKAVPVATLQDALRVAFPGTQRKRRGQQDA